MNQRLYKYFLILSALCFAFGQPNLSSKSIFRKIKEFETKMTVVLKKPEQKMNQVIQKGVKKIAEPIQDIRQAIAAPFRGNLTKQLDPEHLRDDSVAVRVGPELAPEEIKYLARRQPILEQGFETVFGTNPQRKPTIAVCCSGGGYRALVGTAGFMRGLQETGLLDCVTYGSYLSGSTWYAAPWVLSGQKPSAFSSEARSRVELKLTDLIYDSSEILGEITSRFGLTNKPLTLLDVWGRMLGHRLLLEFGDRRKQSHLEDLIPNVANGGYPLPIFTSVIRRKAVRYEWCEFTPFEVGSDYLNGFIPAWSLGRTFKDGKAVDCAYQHTMGYLMGVWGSAFTATIEEAFEQTLKGVNLGSWYSSWIRLSINPFLLSHGIQSARMPNFVYNLGGCQMTGERMLEVIDAGIVFNLPVPPLLKKARNVDIIIIADMSMPINGNEMLLKVVDYARRRKLPFPAIPSGAIPENGMELFYEEGKPMVIYLPLVAQAGYSAAFNPTTSGYCDLDNFKYTASQFDELSGLMEYQVTSHSDAITGAIQNWIDTHN